MKKRLLSIFIIVALIASLAVALVACGDKDEGVKLKEGLSAKEAAVAFLGYDIKNATIIVYSYQNDEDTSVVTRRMSDTCVISDTIYTYGGKTSKSTSAQFLEDGKLYNLEIENEGTKDEYKDYTAIDLAGSNLTEDLGLLAYEQETLQYLLTTALGIGEYVVKTTNNSISITIVDGSYTTIIEISNINTTSLALPAAFSDYKDNTDVLDNGKFSDCWDEGSQEYRLAFAGLEYDVDKYEIPEKFEDEDVEGICVNSSISVKTLIIPKSIQFIDNTYSLKRINTIIYKGTKAEFASINIEYSYYNIVVICSDGNYTIPKID